MDRMENMTGSIAAPLARILIRYGTGLLAAYGMLSEEAAGVISADPDLILVAAVGLAVLNEVFYLVARRKGWST